MKAYKVRLELNNKQKTWCNRCAGASRFVYNWGLSEWKRQYEAYKEDNTLNKPSKIAIRTKFNSDKYVMYKWITDKVFPYSMIEHSFECLGKAFNNFFTRIKRGYSKLGYPKFKNRYSRKSFGIRGVKVESDRVFLPKLGWIRSSQTDYIPVGASYGIYATISERAGYWYISVLVKDEIEVEADLNNTIIGIDFGIKSLAVLSSGKVFDNPKPLIEAQSKLKRLQRELSRRNKGGSNYAKTKAKLAKANFTVAKIREHTLHQISSYVTNVCKPSVIVLEDLNVSGMLKNHCLAQAVSDVGFYELRRQIEYKALALGIKVIFVDRWFPSSKTCSNCGCIKDDLTLGDRIFVCNDCGFEIDRDLNAAINLHNMASVV